jgi:phospholipid N-methyltransferase
VSEELLGKVDYIISGIPFSFLDEAVQAEILQKSREILRSGGQFLAYQTSGHLKDPLQMVFGNVHSEWEWRNIPPMTVYQAIK